ncbi:MAG: ABC transporter ATP-binding protein [Planctomycetes bacterium]|nr:ABC transporter ATP-binding protein [Planctomycetota bacterium]
MTVEDELTAGNASAEEGAASPRAPRPALVVGHLSRSYDDLQAVSDLSFSVAPGEILGLVGPNGAGKTTTLRTVAGVLPLQQGSVTIDGHDLASEPVAARSQLAWVTDNPEPFESLTVAEHLEFTASLYGVDEWRERAEELLERFELAEKRDTLGHELSRGMQQKLAFCCAWLHRPGLVLMDEPLSGLDPRGIRSARDAIVELAEEGTAVVLSSHLLELIEALADRILILDGGRRVFSGTLDEARHAGLGAEGGDLEEIFMAATTVRRRPAALSEADRVPQSSEVDRKPSGRDAAGAEVARDSATPGPEAAGQASGGGDEMTPRATTKPAAADESADS